MRCKNTYYYFIVPRYPEKQINNPMSKSSESLYPCPFRLTVFSSIREKNASYFPKNKTYSSQQNDKVLRGNYVKLLNFYIQIKKSAYFCILKKKKS